MWIAKTELDGLIEMPSPFSKFNQRNYDESVVVRFEVQVACCVNEIVSLMYLDWWDTSWDGIDWLRNWVFQASQQTRSIHDNEFIVRIKAFSQIIISLSQLYYLPHDNSDVQLELRIHLLLHLLPFNIHNRLPDVQLWRWFRIRIELLEGWLSIGVNIGYGLNFQLRQIISPWSIANIPSWVQ